MLSVKVLPRALLTSDCAQRSPGIPTYALVVDDLDDGSQAAFVLAGAEEHDAANLDAPPVARLDIRHLD